MVAEMHWFAVAAFATLMTAAWLYVDRRITTSAALAAVTWSWLSVTGDSLVRYTQTGAEIQLSVGTLQYVTALLALLSLLALVLKRFGHYPPTDSQDSDTDTPISNTTNVTD